MGIDIRVETAAGATIEELLDPRSLTRRLLPGFSDTSSYCLRFVDPAGDAVFNQLQIPILVDEVRRSLEVVRHHASREHGERVLRLLESAQGQVHTYVRFVGD
jgi:hypothetical protein